MELSLFLAQLFGLTIAIFAGIAVFRPGLIRGMISELGQNKTQTLLFSMVGIMGGLSVILSHNVWVGDWRVLVTIFGWSALIKGVLYLVSPGLLRDMGMSIYSSPGRTRIILLVAGVLGVYLAGAGFGML